MKKTKGSPTHFHSCPLFHVHFVSLVGLWLSLFCLCRVLQAQVKADKNDLRVKQRDETQWYVHYNEYLFILSHNVCLKKKKKFSKCLSFSLDKLQQDSFCCTESESISNAWISRRLHNNDLLLVKSLYLQCAFHRSSHLRLVE